MPYSRNSIAGAGEPQENGSPAADNAASAPEASSTDREAEDPADTRTDLLEKAKKFLEHEDVRHKSESDKKIFLLEKGLSEEEITPLLCESTPQASSSTTSIPPIVTYPEFLLRNRDPPPMLTRELALNVAYTSAIVSAVLYGTSTYLLQPMFQSLSAARCSLFDAAKLRLDGINDKLAGVVSSIPETTSRAPGKDNWEGSEAGDPAELFHRDIGIQTSLPSPSATDDGATSQASPATKHTSDLQELRGTLAHILDSSGSALDEEEQVRHDVRELQRYLDDFGLLKYSTVGGLREMSGLAQGVENNDEIANLRKEVRSMKSVMLSTKNFPSAGVYSHGR